MNFGEISPERWRLINWILLAAILLIGAFLRFYNLTYATGTHPDERHMVSVTLDLSLLDCLNQESNDNTNYKDGCMNPRSFAYGSLSYYLVWIASESVGYFWPDFRSYDGIFKVGRTVCVVFGLITVLLTYLIAHQLYQSKLTALVAASFLSFNFFHIQLSRYFTSDVLLTTFCLATLCSILAYESSAKFRYAALSGIFIGAAFATKISSVFLAVPLGLTFVFLVFFSQRLSFNKALISIVLVTLITLLTAFLCAPYFVLDFKTFWAHTQEQTNMARGIWRPPYTIQYAKTTPYLYHLSQMFNFTIGWPVFLAILCGLAWTLIDCFRKPSHRFWIVISWIAIFFLATAGLQVKFPRYLLPLYPLLFVFGAAALTRLLYGVEVRSPQYFSTHSFGNSYSSGGFSPVTMPWASKLDSLRSFMSTHAWTMPSLAALSMIGLVSSILIPSQWFYTLLFAWIMAWGMGITAVFIVDWKKNLSLESETVEWTTLEIWCLAGLLFVALLARCIQLNDLPMFLHNQEMGSGLAARSFFNEIPPPLFSIGWLGQPQLGFFFTSLFMQFFGNDLFGLRMSSVVFGLLSLLGTYLLIRLLFNRKIAFILLALNATYHWHVHYSRTGFFFMFAISASVWSIYLFALAWKKRSYGYSAIAGVLMSIAMQSYHMAYVVPLILTVWALLGALFEKQRVQWALKSIGILFGFCILTAAPLIAFMLNAPEPVGAGAYDTFVFAQNNTRHVTSVVGSSDFKAVMLFQLERIALFFWETRDASVQYGFSGRFVDIIVWIPFAIGIVWCFWSIKHRGAQLLLIWLLIVVGAGGVLSIDPPFTPRLLGIATIILGFSAITFSNVMTWCHAGNTRLRRAGFEFCIFLVVGSMFWNLYAYFKIYPNQMPGERRDRVVRLLEDDPRIKTVLNAFPEAEEFGYESYQFMAPYVRGFNVTSQDAMAQLETYNLLDSAMFAPATMVNIEEKLTARMSIAHKQVITDSRNPEGFQWIILRHK